MSFVRKSNWGPQSVKSKDRLQTPPPPQIGDNLPIPALLGIEFPQEFCKLEKHDCNSTRDYKVLLGITMNYEHPIVSEKCF